MGGFLRASWAQAAHWDGALRGAEAWAALSPKLASPTALGPGAGESPESVSFSTEVVPGEGGFRAEQTQLTPHGTGLMMGSEGGQPSLRTSPGGLRLESAL